MADKYHSDSSQKIETITYAPGLQVSADLEGGTKTVTRTAEASGLGNADYAAVLTLPAPVDARLAVLRTVSRLSLTINSDDGVHDLRCRVYVDAQDVDHLLFDLTFSTTGNQLSAQDCNCASPLVAAIKEIIFNLQKDGGAHTFYVFLWTPGNHAPLVSECTLWEGVGTCSATASPKARIFSLILNGLIEYQASYLGVGASTLFAGTGISEDAYVQPSSSTGGSNYNYHSSGLHLASTPVYLVGLLQLTTVTGIAYLQKLNILIRSDN